jgi:hypothetical protein
MKSIIAAAVGAAVLALGGAAYADMQPIPNPPETHHGGHHGHGHHARHHHMMRHHHHHHHHGRH